MLFLISCKPYKWSTIPKHVLPNQAALHEIDYKTPFQLPLNKLVFS